MRLVVSLVLAALMVLDPSTVFTDAAKAQTAADSADSTDTNSRGRKRKKRKKRRKKIRRKRPSKSKIKRRKSKAKIKRRKSKAKVKRRRRPSAKKRPSDKRRRTSQRRRSTKRPKRVRKLRKAYNPYFKRLRNDKSGRFQGYVTNRRKKKTIGYTNRRGKAFFQGDIKLGSVRNLNKKYGKKRGKGARGAVQNNIDRLWPMGTIPYAISGDLKANATTHGYIKDAIKILNKKTNLRLLRRTNQKDYILFIKSDGCASWVGRQGGKMEIDIAVFGDPEGHCTTGAVIHEILHAAGLWHTQSRTDRGKYVKINRNNIIDDNGYNFDANRDDIGSWYRGQGARIEGRYEYKSIMHYGSYYFAKDPGACYGSDGTGGDMSKCTIVTKNGGFIEPNETLTTNDIRIINALYPKQNSTNYELEELQRRCKLTIRRYCRNSRDVVACLKKTRARLKRKYPNRPFGDSNACRDQYSKVVNKRFDPNRDLSKKESADSKATRKACPYTVKKYCRHAFDAAECVLKTERRIKKKNPKKVFGDHTKCRRHLKKLKNK